MTTTSTYQPTQSQITRHAFPFKYGSYAPKACRVSTFFQPILCCSNNDKPSSNHLVFLPAGVQHFVDDDCVTDLQDATIDPKSGWIHIHSAVF
ncbi:hypothetical protein L210DRAFT_141200 [Boletus edulis BED1]|uniref:Uncharacterized protein n=1 Tax=Boletus edulis BED1 TaxID=1328754 RepID=A0AAD4C8G1_BOLED|nr:hypothetical protein L210DRAFT_141200 [Boletus edulis BED1]